MNKIIFAVDGVVKSVSTVYAAGGSVTCNLENHEQFGADINTDVAEGYTVTKNEDGTVTFDKPVA
jgi:site-specific DNA-adenine methylase